MQLFPGPSEARCEAECVHPERVRPLIGQVIDDHRAADAVRVFETLVDPTRLRLLQALSLTPELCVCDLAFLIGRSVSATSRQLRMLHERDVVGRRKEGRIVYYRLADGHIRRLLEDALTHAGEMGRRTSQLVAGESRRERRHGTVARPG